MAAALYFGAMCSVCRLPSRRTTTRRRRPRAAALRRRAGARVLGDERAQARLALTDLRGGEAGRVARRPVDRQDPVAGAQLPGGRAARVDEVDLERVAHLPERQQQHPDDREGDQEVHERPGGDHDDALPDRLREVGPMRDLRRDALVRVHPGDLHVAAERHGPDRVLRLPPPVLEQQRREEQREALDPHPDGLRRGEVAELVQDDQGGEAGEGEEVAHARLRSALTSSAASARASRSAS